MAHQPDNQLPLGARLLPGVDLRLWLVFAVIVLAGVLAVAVLAMAWS